MGKTQRRAACRDEELHAGAEFHVLADGAERGVLLRVALLGEVAQVGVPLLHLLQLNLVPATSPQQTQTTVIAPTGRGTRRLDHSTHGPWSRVLSDSAFSPKAHDRRGGAEEVHPIASF